ncbi:MAG TPA: methyltransferase domain-containing protein [Candidatus Bipolaricaulota bacterium]|nr:methyltransferase domain-containing protein [Candidatus Bipolaricaulota bacterium]
MPEMLFWVILFAFLFFSLIIAIVFSMNVFILPFVGGVPYVSLKKKRLKKIFLKQRFDFNAQIVDLGCGDGRVLRFLEKNGYKNLRGYELNLWPYCIGKIKNLCLRSKTLIRLKNFEKINLKEFDVIFVYLMEKYLEKLRPKFEKELAAGATVISYGFQVNGWTPKEIIYTDEGNKKLGKTYVYERQ